MTIVSCSGNTFPYVNECFCAQIEEGSYWSDYYTNLKLDLVSEWCCYRVSNVTLK